MFLRPVIGAGRMVGVCALAAVAVGAQQPPPQSPTFRTQTTLMSVEVRVIDRQGRPIAGLTPADFTLTEDGVPQRISHFAPIILTPQPELATEEPAVLRVGTRPADQPSSRRVFLIVLGRGNLQIPSKGLDGMIHLVRNRLLPQDLVAVLAWNRATPFTTSHEKIAAMLERYRAGHQRVESLLAQHFSGLAAIYGSRDIPEWMQRDIDQVLHGPDAAALRTLVPETPGFAGGIESRIRRETAVLQGTASLDVFGAAEAEAVGMSLDDYVSNRVQSMQDLTRIYAGLGYLRHLDGEKHLVYVSPRGLGLPSADDDRGLARVAQDARVVIDIFHSSGMSAGMWDVASSQNIAELTGGQFTGLTYGDKFVDRVDAATRTAYQLGYYPSKPELDGKYRKISIKVHRSGAQALYRHGHFATNAVATIDRRDMITRSRVAAALRYGREVRDLEVSATARRGRTKDGKHEVVVQLSVAPGGLAVTPLLHEHTVSLDVAVFCADRGQIVGQRWERVDVRLNDASYANVKARGLGFTVHVPVRRTTTQCKAAVYDINADRVGTAVPVVGK